MIKKTVSEMLGEILRSASSGFFYTAPFYAMYPTDCEDKPERLAGLMIMGVLFAVIGIALERIRK